MRIYLVVFLLLACGCSLKSTDHIGSKGLSDKVTFDVSRLDNEGLKANTGSKRSLSYEFCIPNTPECKGEVKSIDSGVEFLRSHGRIGCGKGQLLCIDSTHQTVLRKYLRNFADLSILRA